MKNVLLGVIPYYAVIKLQNVLADEELILN